MGQQVDNNNGGVWASWYLQGSKNALGEYHEGRVRNTMGSREELDELEATDHSAARRKMNPQFAPSEAEVNRRKEAAEAAEIQRAVNAVQSKDKVESREAAKSPNLHTYNDTFQQSQPAHEEMSAAKMTAFFKGASSSASVNWLSA